MIEKKFTPFTEVDQQDLYKLPPPEVHAFYERLSEITIRNKLNDDQYEANYDKIKEDTTKLFDDIKTRLQVFRESGQ